MNAKQLRFLRNNTELLVRDHTKVNWLIKLDNHYIKNIANNLNLTSQYNTELFYFIGYLLNARKQGF